jgi:hypothetical protein
MSFTAKKVKKKISNLHMEAAAGPNGIGSMFLRELDVGLAPVLFSQSQWLVGKSPRN